MSPEVGAIVFLASVTALAVWGGVWFLRNWREFVKDSCDLWVSLFK